MLKRVMVAVLLVAAAAVSGCATDNSMSSRAYTPPDKADREVFSKARRDVYPKQVRENPARYRDVNIAWAGIVKDVDVVRSKSGLSVVVLVEHHYFDWIEDHGAQPEVFFLSPRGEGNFMIILEPKREMTKDEARKLLPAGTMLVAVGQIYQPTASDKKYPLVLLTDYRQFIDKKWYRTDVLDYGRDGEPSGRVEGSEFWRRYGKS